MNNKKEELIKTILKVIGDDPNRIGLKKTPERVVNMWEEIFKGYNPSLKPIVTTFPNGQDKVIYDEMIIDIGESFSLCEHHMLPFKFTYFFAYIPSKRGKILGLSKVGRVVDYCASKLQIQERLGEEIVNLLWEELSKKANPPLGMGLIIKGEHLCKIMRGNKKKGIMITSVMRGNFKTQKQTREEFLNLIQNGT